MNTWKFRAAFLALTVAALVAVPALAAQTASEERSETPTAASERTTVRVVNDNWHDITVYAVRGRISSSIGHRNLLRETRVYASADVPHTER